MLHTLVLHVSTLHTRMLHTLTLGASKLNSPQGRRGSGNGAPAPGTEAEPAQTPCAGCALASQETSGALFGTADRRGTNPAMPDSSSSWSH